MPEELVPAKEENKLRTWLEGDAFTQQLAKVLPEGMSPARFARIVWTACTRNPVLKQTERESFFRCILEMASFGLEADGRRAHLIPRRDKNGVLQCTWQADYKGLKELLYRNKDVVSEHSDVVLRGDLFEYEFGTNEFLRHKPNGAIDRTDTALITCAYCYVKLPGGSLKFDVMSRAEILRIQKRSPAASGESSPWTTDWAEMAKKTVFRRVSKGLPLSPQTREVVERDDEDDAWPQTLSMPQVPVRAQVPTLESEPSVEEVPPAPRTPERKARASQKVRSPEPPQEKVPEPAPTPTEPTGDPLVAQVRAALAEADIAETHYVSWLFNIGCAKSETIELDEIAPKFLRDTLANWDANLEAIKVFLAQ